MSVRPLAALVAVFAVFAVYAPAAGATDRPGGEVAQLRTTVLVKKFVVRKTGLVALGTAATQVNGTATRQEVALTTQTRGNCEVLTLNLDRLNLALLGLNVDVSAVNLRVTGNRRKTLGALFCRLATQTRLGRVAAARSAATGLNRRLADEPMQVIGFNAVIRPQVAPPEGDPQPAPSGARSAQTPAPAGPRCNVLDLTLGPLNLDLLGLVVDLYGKTANDPVQVKATADPNGGLLGKTFCDLSGGPR